MAFLGAVPALALSVDGVQIVPACDNVEHVPGLVRRAAAGFALHSIRQGKTKGRGIVPGSFV